MKTIYSILFGLLFILFTQASCENDKENSSISKIFGEWERIEISKDCQGGFSSIEISSDSIFKGFYKDTLYFESSFHLKKGDNFDTLIFKNHEQYHRWSLINLKDKDTIEFVPPITTITPTCKLYERIK